MSIIIYFVIVFILFVFCLLFISYDNHKYPTPSHEHSIVVPLLFMALLCCIIWPITLTLSMFIYAIHKMFLYLHEKLIPFWEMGPSQWFNEQIWNRLS